jgi:uncharacterized membrane protein affecting hemolysin expression
MMGKNKKSYAKTLPILAMLFAIFISTLGALTINQQISITADKQERYLGNTLALQLAKVAKTSIINKDILSLQIELDDMLAIDGVGYVAIYDASKKILAKAKGVTQKNTQDNLGDKYTKPITIENEIAGYGLIQFYDGFFIKYFQAINITIALLFIGMFSILIYASVKSGKILSFRLNRIIQQLPSDSDESSDELSMLENRLKPLISSRISDQMLGTEEEHEESTVLAIECKNLTILKTRVNPEHLESLMHQFDVLINDAADIYGARRFNSDRRCVYLKFRGNNNTDEYPLRALCCASVIHRLGEKLLDAHGIKLELSSAILSVKYKNFKSQLLQESTREDHLSTLQFMLQQAVGDEILLDEKTKEHKSLDGTVLSPPSEKSLLFRVEELDQTCKRVTSQQIEILSRDI